MRRSLFECGSCGRRFKKSQALFGHLRHCERHRRLKAEAKAQASNQPPGQLRPQENQPRSTGQGDDSLLSHRCGRDSHENLMLLLDISEILPELKRKSLNYAAICRLFANVRPWMT